MDSGQPTREIPTRFGRDGVTQQQDPHPVTLQAVTSRIVGRLHRIVMPSDFVRLVLDPVRLAVLGESVAQPIDTADLARRLDVPQRTVTEALGKLRGAGLVGDDGLTDRSVLRRVAESLPQMPDADATIITGPWSAEEAEVLSRFFSGDRLESIPSNLAKRRIVLERLAQEFEPGLRYEEADVNFRLQLFHPDYAALRRYLVDEELLTRAQGVYWRSGGRFDDPVPGADDDA